ncbi:Ca2+-transporting ATPase [Seinonella peptonophila]|uniref:P-type Ca(2+) transporter n=1 Tax=Seinonella peptonophila TaxID=112248 RepID=A0A1M4UXD8_9BACL|nr:Ca2+-transporting ATPase [Seinonella peptonophila]
MSQKARWIDWDQQRLTSHFGVDPHRGLSMSDAEKRLHHVGRNQLVEGEKISLWALFLDQFKDFMVLVLMGATLISGLLGEYHDAIAIIAIVILNAVLGFVQEIKAEKSLAALKKLSAPGAKVLRNGEWNRIDAADLVPGDIVALESGDRVPADLRLLRADNLYLEESTLTGESVPVNKSAETLAKADLPIGDRKNMVYMSTMVVRGTGTGVVVQTGMETEMGRIAHLIQHTESSETPLSRRLEQLGKILIVIALILTAVVVITGIIHGHDAYKMFLAGVSLAVAAIPEGLPAIVTIALAMGVQRMIKRRAIVRKLPSVETLGCATVICSDKTGTLTQNKMTVTHTYLDARVFELESSQLNSETWKRMIEIGILCNNALLQRKPAKKLLKRKQDNWKVDGDPTEAALLIIGAKQGIWQDELLHDWTRVKEFPFDSQRKMMSVVYQHRDGRQVIFAKGAPDVLLDRCSHQMQRGKTSPFTLAHKRSVSTMNERLASMALRNLAFAYRELGNASERQLSEGQIERNLTFVGLVGMIDPPREEVRGAIQRCRQAGIRTVMITGDHQATAQAIAHQLGIIRPQGLTVSGSDLYNMSDKEFQHKVEEIDVYARVSPEHKIKIVQALQAKGHVVAMTGDGVNDAPAIKAADIGIAMGKSGTDVSKEASSLVLADDNFSTIVAAIEEGRSIYDNIRKFIAYLLASNVGEILVMFLAMLAGLPLPLVPIQILWVNLVTDGLPAMALGVDPAEGDMMQRSPRNSRESVFARGIGWKIITRGLLIGFWSLAAFLVTYYEAPQNLSLAQTVAFATLVLSQLIYVFDCRSTGSIFQRNPLSNIPLVLSVILSVVMLLVVIYYPPLQPIFHTVSLGLREWILICVTSTLPVILAGLVDQVRIVQRKLQLGR